MFLVAILAVITLALLYIFFLREWMVARWPQLRWWHEQVEDRFWESSRTIFAARLYWVGGLIIFIHDGMAQSGYVDWTPLVTELANFLPAQWRPFALAAWPLLTGVLFEWLRWMTIQPVRPEPAPDPAPDPEVR